MKVAIKRIVRAERKKCILADSGSEYKPQGCLRLR